MINLQTKQFLDCKTFISRSTILLYTTYIIIRIKVKIVLQDTRIKCIMSRSNNNHIIVFISLFFMLSPVLDCLPHTSVYLPLQLRLFIYSLVSFCCFNYLYLKVRHLFILFLPQLNYRTFSFPSVAQKILYSGVM